MLEWRLPCVLLSGVLLIALLLLLWERLVIFRLIEAIRSKENLVLAFIDMRTLCNKFVYSVKSDFKQWLNEAGVPFGLQESVYNLLQKELNN